MLQMEVSVTTQLLGPAISMLCPMQVVWSVMVLALATCTTGCPLVNVSNCQCAYKDISCYGGITTIPDFDTFDMDLDMVYSSLDLSDQAIGRLPPRAFTQIKVKKIILDFNPLKDNIHRRAFVSLEDELEDLHISACGLSSISGGFLNGLNSLKRLHLWGNRIRVLVKEVFSKSKSLEEIRLWRNLISSIEEDAFSGLNGLKILDLDSNYLTDVKLHTFRHLRGLEALYLRNNKIHRLRRNAFRYLVNLKVLNLDNNGLFDIYPGALHGLPNLLSLRLPYNRVRILHNHLFQTNVLLEVLVLHHNKLNRFNCDGLKHLHTLDLSYNPLSYLKGAAVSKTSELRYLYLDHIQIPTLRKATYDKMKLKILSLVGNPIMCDCRIAWITGLRKKGVDVFGTCGYSPTGSLQPIINPISYQIAECPHN